MYQAYTVVSRFGATLNFEEKEKEEKEVEAEDKEKEEKRKTMWGDNEKIAVMLKIRYCTACVVEFTSLFFKKFYYIASVA